MFLVKILLSLLSPVYLTYKSREVFIFNDHKRMDEGEIRIPFKEWQCCIGWQN